MYTDDQYERAKKALDNPDYPEDLKPRLRERIAEYEAAHNAPAEAPAADMPAAASAAPEAPPEPAAPDRNAQVAEILGKYGAPAPEPAPAQPVGERPTVNSIEMPKQPELIDIEPAPPPYGPPEEPGKDSSLNNASKLLRFKNIPNEHKSNSHSALGAIANNMAHRLGDYSAASSTMWFEPSREKFETDMGAYLKTKGITRDNPAYQLAYNAYRDSEWKKAYQEAVINDMPLTRAEFAPGDSGWKKVGNFLGQSADAATAFADGMARGYAGPARGLAVAARDRLTGRDDLGEMREREERHPWISGTGAFVGSLLPGNIFGKVAGKVYGTPATTASTAAKLARAGLAGSVAADVDLIANTLGTGVENIIKGTPTEQSLEQIEQLPERLGVTSLLGFGGGVAGELIAKGAGALRKRFRTQPSPLHPSLPNAEATGSQTSFLYGMEPNEQLKAILEKARGPVPGEARGPIMGEAVEYAAKPTFEPIVDQQARDLALNKLAMGIEKQRFVDSDPVLKHQKIEATNTLDALHGELVRRNKPGASPEAFPSPGNEMGAWNTNKRLFDTYKGLVEPKVHVEALLPAGSFRDGGSRFVSVPEARALGFDIELPKVRPSRPPPPDLPTPPMEAPAGDLAPRDTIPAPRDPADWANPANSPPRNDNSVPPPFLPESAFVVELKPIQMGPLEFESAVHSIDLAGKASKAAGHEEQIWSDLLGVARKDRDKFAGGRWSQLYNRHNELMGKIEQQGKNAGIVGDETYAKMEPNNRLAAEETIKNYGTRGEQRNEALSNLADAAGRNSGKDVRYDLEGVRATRGFLDLKEKASLGGGLTSGAGPLGLGGLVPGAKLRLDAIARGLAHDTQGRPLYVPGGGLPGRRSLLPGVGGGGLGVFAGIPFESAINADRARSTGSLDKEQMRIIDEALRQK